MSFLVNFTFLKLIYVHLLVRCYCRYRFLFPKPGYHVCYTRKAVVSGPGIFHLFLQIYSAPPSHPTPSLWSVPWEAGPSGVQTLGSLCRSSGGSEGEASFLILGSLPLRPLPLSVSTTYAAVWCALLRSPPSCLPGSSVSSLCPSWE